MWLPQSLPPPSGKYQTLTHETSYIKRRLNTYFQQPMQSDRSVQKSAGLPRICHLIFPSSTSTRPSFFLKYTLFSEQIKAKQAAPLRLPPVQSLIILRFVFPNDYRRIFIFFLENSSAEQKYRISNPEHKENHPRNDCII